MTAITAPTIPYPATFVKCRSIAFGLITFISLLWLVLLCVVSFIEWDISDRSKKALLLVLLLTNTVTIITLPILVIREFRPWLDAIRLLLLCMINIGSAALFTVWGPKSPCPARSAGGMGRCEIFNLLSIITAWTVCALLIAYAVGLALMVHYRRHIVQKAQGTHSASSSMSELIKERDVEAAVPATPASSFYPATPSSSFYPGTPTSMRPPSMMPTPRSVNVPQPIVVKPPPRHSMSASITPPNSFRWDAHAGLYRPRPQSQTPSQVSSRKSSFIGPMGARMSMGSHMRASRVPVPPVPNMMVEQRKSLYMDSGDSRFKGVSEGRFSKVSRVPSQRYR